MRLISAVEAALHIIDEWSDDESNTGDIVILSPDTVDQLTDDQEVQDNNLMIDNG